MADILTISQRHKCMSHNKGKNTMPELIVRRYLYSHGYRFRIHVKKLWGSPDIVIRRLKTVILVNGCFWHGHEGCKYYKIPQTNTEFWQAKIDRNKARDAETKQQLNGHGWNVITIWECQLKPNVREDTLRSLIYTLSKIELAQTKGNSNQ